ncbi:MAG: ATP-binding protein [Myxococcales bacterium]|nr:ATP-binding protein [Myxococcales bacterium]
MSNWKASPIRYQGQYDWVIRHAKRAFPDIMGTIEFDRGLAYLFRPNDSDPANGLSPDLAADGLLTGLLHLTAVAGARDGSIIAFDEFENQLHPYAIRGLLQAIREEAERRDLTIIMTTHSPVVMNEFRREPEKLHVLTGDERQPYSLIELLGADALLQARLGELYEQLDFAAPSVAPEFA